MKIFDAIALILLVVALISGSYFLWLNLPVGGETFESFSANLSEIPESYVANVSGEITQFYHNMRYRDRVINYSISSACDEKKSNSINRAFEILSEKTILSFVLSGNFEISILCSDIAPKAEEKGHFIAGEGGPSEIINTTQFAVILNGKVSLYRENKCDEPKVAIHEILHALGFDHYNNKSSILYPVTSCEQQIDEEVIKIIDSLYSVDSLPDLVIDYVSATSEGRYLNFNINISNIGLDDSIGAELSVLSDDKEVESFELGILEIGEKKILSVENLKLPSRNVGKILFLVKSDDVSELNMNNNRVEVSAL